MARLPRLMGRGRALEVLLSADDIPADVAERYGYVNRCFPDAEMVVCYASIERPATQRRIKTLLERGLHKAGDVETRLGYHVGQLGDV